MAFPIRYKLIDRVTGKELKGKDEAGEPICALLRPSGSIAKQTQDFYTFVRELSPRDYELHVAMEKDGEGHWIYKKVGY